MQYLKEMQRAIDGIANGDIIIIYDAEDRESEGDFAFAGCFSTPEKVNFCIKNGGGLLCLSVTPDIAKRVGIVKQKSNDKEIFRTPFGTPINLAGITSGISAQDRSETILKASNPHSDSSMFSYPGHVHTLIAHENGLRGRGGHTEAVIDLIKASGLESPGVLCEILSADGQTAKYPELEELSRKFKLPLICRDWIEEYLNSKILVKKC